MGEDGFITGLRNLLSAVEYLNKEDADLATEIVKDFMKAQRRRQFTCSGKCLNCGTGIQYGELCRSHTRYGDEWLKSFQARWKTPMIVEECGRWNEIRITLNGFSDKTVLPYLCKQCTEEAYVLGKSEKERKQQELQSKMQRVRAQDQDIVEGKVKSHPYERYRALVSSIGRNKILSLTEMPYADFLTTIYWDVIRKYKLYKSGYKCELCNSKGLLNVHHKSYEHHGEEHLHMEDLIVLCADCHSKFHGKD